MCLLITDQYTVIYFVFFLQIFIEMSPDCLIPRHVTGLYVFTVVNLLALLQFSVVNGDVTVVSVIIITGLL